MTDAPHNPEALAEPIVGRKRRFSLVWLFPLVAAAIGAWLVFTTLQDQGPTISIQFKTAAGLEAGKTKIKHKNVELGMVESVALSDDLSHILVTAALQKEAEPHLRDDTRFWVVRPRLGVGGVSGLDTLVSGAYIELDPGSGEPRREFTGLESPPIVRSDEPGREFVLVADRLGSLSAGSPIYFRGLDVGEVLGYKLADDDSSLRIEVFIRAPHDALVRTNTRFWNASGVSITMDADGVKVATESIEALLAGGLAFETPAAAGSEVAAAGTTFKLYPDFASISEAAFVRSIPFVLLFEGSVRGLSVGAPVEFRGIKVGSVTDIRLIIDQASQALRIPVTIEIEPERALSIGKRMDDPYAGIDTLVRRGLRAQLVSGSLLTGQLLVDLDFHPDAEPAALGRDGTYPEIPTIPSKVEAIIASVTDVLNKIGTLPLEELVNDLRATIQNANAIVGSPDMRASVHSLSESLDRLQAVLTKVDRQTDPLLNSLRATADSAQGAAETARTAMASAEGLVAPNSQLVFSLNKLLEELTDAARSIRVLAEYLESHPEALVRGKGTESP